MSDVVARLAEAAVEHRDRTAVEDRWGRLTYGQWWDEVNRWAETVRRAVPLGGCVAVCAERSRHAIAAVVGCLAAGRTYVPFDDGMPAHRVAQMLADCAPAALIAPAPVAATLPPAVRPPAVVDLHDRTPRPGLSGTAAAADSVADAYVLYTSGSTGVPKGVRISAGNLSAFVGWAREAFALGPGHRLPVCSSLSFDMAVLDVFAGLSAGVTLCPVDSQTLLFPRDLARFLQERRITMVYAVPTLLQNLVARAGLAAGQLSGLDRILYAGEDFPVRRLHRLAQIAPRARVANLYGPIETNVVTWHEVTEEDFAGGRIPIGRPLPGTTITLWDDTTGAPAAPGRRGEIVVIGPSVSPGYLNDPVRTGASRIGDGYRTGDIAVHDARGRLVLHGRRDAMFKARGFRVEPGDIEAALLDHPEVTEAVAFPVETSASLVVQAAVTVVAAAQIGEPGLLAWCRDRLPVPLVPERVHVVRSMPHTRTGKLDRRTLATTLSQGGIR